MNTGFWFVRSPGRRAGHELCAMPGLLLILPQEMVWNGIAELERHPALHPGHTAGAALLLRESECEMPAQHVGICGAELQAKHSERGGTGQPWASSKTQSSPCVPAVLVSPVPSPHGSPGMPKGYGLCRLSMLPLHRLGRGMSRHRFF